MPQTAGEIILSLRDQFIKTFKEAEAKLPEVKGLGREDGVLNNFYLKPYKEELDHVAAQPTRVTEINNILANKTTGSIYGVIGYIFDLAYFSAGLDVLDQEPRIPKLDRQQLQWLDERFFTLKEDLFKLFQNLIVTYLKHYRFEISPNSRASIASVSDNSAENYEALIRAAKENHKQVLNTLQDLCKNVCDEIQRHRKNFQKHLAEGPQTTVNISNHPSKIRGADEKHFLVPGGSSSSAAVSYTTNTSIVPTNFSSSDPFFFAAGWTDASHPNLFLYAGSSSYREAVAMHQMADCCASLCASAAHAHTPACSCGQNDCHCLKAAFECHTCGGANCDCLHAVSGCCHHGGGGGGNGDCCKLITSGCGGVFVLGAGGASVAGNAASNGGNGTNSTDVAIDINNLSANATAAAHTVFLSDTTSKVAVSAAYGVIAGPRILYRALLPLARFATGLVSLCNDGVEPYKVGRSAARLSGQVIAAAAVAVPLYLVTFGGPHSAIAAAGSGAVIGNMVAKKIIQARARKKYNGISNPEKWILKSKVLQNLKEQGLQPKDVVEIIFEIKRVLAAVKSGRSVGKKVLNAWWDFLPDCARGEIEVHLKKAMNALRGGELELAKTELTKVVAPALAYVHGLFASRRTANAGAAAAFDSAAASAGAAAGKPPEIALTPTKRSPAVQ